MQRPRLFLSAVSEELRSARRAVAATVRTLGYDVVSQDDFATGHGELRQWLREQIDGCEGLVQLVGEGYGAEPPEVDPDYKRVSYTQFEFLYARLRGKKTWVIIVGPGCHRDTPPEKLDLPRDPAHPDPSAYRAERQAIQQTYVAQLRADNHLRHRADSDLALENVVLKLRDELREERQRNDRRWSRLVGMVAALLVGGTVLGGAGWGAWRSLKFDVKQVGAVNTEKIRAHLRATLEATRRRELAEAEKSKDWRDRQRLKEAAETAHAGRLAKIDELAASFAEIEAGGNATSVFTELTRILTEQGVDAAIAFVATQQAAILQAVKARAASAREKNRADLQPLLKAASLHRSKGQVDAARGLYRDILAAEPEWPEALHGAIWFYFEQGDRAQIYATLEVARKEYEEAQRLARRFESVDRANLEALRDLATALTHLGGVAFAQGRLEEAGGMYGEGLKLRQTPAERDRSTPQWQHDLSVSYSRLGEVAVAQGKLEEAARAYGEHLKITQALAKSDPGNPQWRRDVAVSYSKLGDVAVEQEEWAEAARAYGEDLKITRALAESDRGNLGWQRDLSISYDRLGDVAVAQENREEDARWYGEALKIRQALAGRDPNNTEWQRDLSISLSKLGDVAAAQEKWEEAAGRYGTSLSIRQALAQADPNNPQWQRDVGMAYWRLADLAEKQNQPKAAQAHWQAAYAAVVAIEQRGLSVSPQDRRILEILRKKAGK